MPVLNLISVEAAELVEQVMLEEVEVVLVWEMELRVMITQVVGR